MEHSHAALTRQMRETARLVNSQQVRDLLFTGASVLDRLAGELAATQSAAAQVATDAQQVAACQKPDLPYMEWHADADRRVAAGEEQTYCQTCERWKWPDHARDCPRYVRSMAAEALARGEVPGE